MRSPLLALPPAVLALVARALAPQDLKLAFRAPGHRAAHRALLSAALACRALRAVCFPLAASTMRSPGLRPQYKADLGDSVKELEARIDYILAHAHLWPYVKKLDIEIHARAPARLSTKLVELFTILPNLTFIALKLPAYHVFRDPLVSDLRSALGDRPRVFSKLTTLCVDAQLDFLLSHAPGLRELVVWSWPGKIDREGGLSPKETADAWRTFLAQLTLQAPNVQEFEIGGLSISDANELFPSIANRVRSLDTLRILHRTEQHGALALYSSNPYPNTIPEDLVESTTEDWEDAREDDPPIVGRPGRVRRVLLFDLQDEYGSVYVPASYAFGSNGKSNASLWVNQYPALILSCKSLRNVY